jgi:hypothetical protein
MIENKKWFSSLTPLSHKKYVTFGDNKKGKVLGIDVIKINDCFTLNDVALVDRLRYNLLFVSQLYDVVLSILFRKSDSYVLDSSGKRVYGISRIENVFQADFSSAQSSLKCLILQSSFELWKWHRRLGYLRFDLLYRLSGLDLLWGLPLLKFESGLIYVLYHHGKMIAASHSPVNTVMTEHPEQLLYMNIVGPSRVRSMGGKWYILIIVDNYSHYSWVFFLVSKDEVFEHFWSLVLRLNNEHPNWLKAIHNDNGTEFRNVSFDEFCLEHGIDQQFFTPCVPQQNGIVEQKNHTLVEMDRTMLDEHMTPRRFWADAISTACYISNQIFLRLILHLTPFSSALAVSLLSLTLDLLVANALFWNVTILISLRLALLMASCLDTPLMADLTEFITLRLTTLLSHMMWPSTRLLLVLLMCLSVQVTKKWRRSSL